eukprot:jgi/Chrzof1/2379/Cz11g12270.t1
MHNNHVVSQPTILLSVCRGILGCATLHTCLIRLVLLLLLQSAGEAGATAPPPADQDVDLHFVAFVEKNGEQHDADCAHGDSGVAHVGVCIQ